jgi:alpha-glucosidase
MPWSAGPGGGFTTGTPWLRLGLDVDSRNVESQAADPDSILACYRRIIAARAAVPALQDGRLTLARTSDPDVLVYRRSRPGSEALVAVAFGTRGTTIRLPKPRHGALWQTVAGSRSEPATADHRERTLRLRPYEAVVLMAARG